MTTPPDVVPSTDTLNALTISDVQPAAPPVSASPDTIFTRNQVDEAVARARKESADAAGIRLQAERDRAASMKAELDKLTMAQKERDDSDARRRAQVDADQQKAKEADMDAKQLINERDRIHKEEMAQLVAGQEKLREEVARRDALLEASQRQADLDRWTQQRIAEEGDSLEPHLIKFIGGNSKEAVEVSIANVKATTAAILEDVQRAQTAQRAATPGASVTAGNTGFENTLDGDPGELSADEIRALPLSDPRWQQLREKYGMAKASQGTGQGLFG